MKWSGWHVTCVISGFCREADENCVLLSYYAEKSGNFLSTCVTCLNMQICHHTFVYGFFSVNVGMFPWNTNNNIHFTQFHTAITWDYTELLQVNAVCETMAWAWWWSGNNAVKPKYNKDWCSTDTHMNTAPWWFLFMLSSNSAITLTRSCLPCTGLHSHHIHIHIYTVCRSRISQMTNRYETCQD
jgi:hypothetical protein